VPVLLAYPRELLMLGIPYTALPFMLLGFASLHITAGLIAVLNATAPLFAALIAHYLLKERLGIWRAGGLFIGFLGVVVLMWGSGSFKSNSGILAVLAVLGTSLTWGLGANYARRHLPSVDALVMTVGSLTAASLFLAPFAWASWADREPRPARLGRADLPRRGQFGAGVPALLPAAAPHRTGPRHVRDLPQSRGGDGVGSALLGEQVTPQMLVGRRRVLLGTALSLGLIGGRPRTGVKSQA
jgi:hypothetical protein